MEPLSPTKPPPPPPLQVEAPATPQAAEPPCPLHKIIIVASVGAGVQFGWALQLALLSPYVQILGTPHMWVSFIWLCGPISGLLVQPIVGYYSDRTTSRFGRRRPFIVAGTLAVVFSGILIGFSADLGHFLGDPVGKNTRPRTIAIFIVGFWIIDFSNNLLQGPLRALLADLAAGDQGKIRTAYALFSFFLAVGNILGSAAGGTAGLHRLFPFTKTHACDDYCANVKSCFLISITLLSTLVAVAITYVKEKTVPFAKNDKEGEKSGGLVCFGELFGAVWGMERPMRILMLVTCLNWVAWFPFILYGTDWMGREVYGGKDKEGNAYKMGVQMGSLGLMLMSVVLAATSLGLKPLAHGLGGEKRLWGIVNFLLAVCMAMTVLVTKLAEHSRRYVVGPDGVLEPLPPKAGVKAGSLALVSALGIPLAITFSVPFTIASIFTNAAGTGQGLSLGVLTIAIVIPQMMMSLLSGPWDALFGGSNLPSFVVGAVAAAISGILSIFLLPSPPPELAKSTTAVAGGFH